MIVFINFDIWLSKGGETHLFWSSIILMTFRHVIVELFEMHETTLWLYNFKHLKKYLD
jgi:hypothetical protein